MVELTEAPKLIIAAQDRIANRRISAEEDELYGNHSWEVSKPLPGLRIIKTQIVYHGITLVLTATETGHYHIFRTVNNRDFSLVHDHETEIFDIIIIDLGWAIFSAEDGLFETTNSGITWSLFELPYIDFDAVVPEYSDWADVPPLFMPAVDEINLDVVVPELDTWSEVYANYVTNLKLAIIPLASSNKIILAYGNDHKIYSAIYPGGFFVEAYDASEWAEKWYPALAGCPVGLLAGAGNKLLRSTQGGLPGTWAVIQEVAGIIKNIVVSDQENTPIFMIEVEGADGETSSLFRTYDLGDSLIPDINRLQVITSVQTVYPTGTNVRQPMFAVSGRRAAGGPITSKIIEVV